MFRSRLQRLLLRFRIHDDVHQFFHTRNTMWMEWFQADRRVNYEPLQLDHSTTARRTSQNHAPKPFWPTLQEATDKRQATCVSYTEGEGSDQGPPRKARLEVT